MACGTGMWTQHLADTHDAVVAVDASPEAIAINQARIRGTRVSYQVADLFAWEPPLHTFDAVFFGFWLSHVPAERFEAFWAVVRAALKPRGRVFFVDSLFEPAATASNHDPIDLAPQKRLDILLVFP
jgi:demethylmenaquinone methyltransferase/2-methoxy-6-polyprenyl-1,4-benzoquinol methylase